MKKRWVSSPSRGAGVVLGESAPELDDLRAGKIGFLPMFDDLSKVNEMQRIAVEETRLGIPVVYCLDVIHGVQNGVPHTVERGYELGA